MGIAKLGTSFRTFSTIDMADILTFIWSLYYPYIVKKKFCCSSFLSEFIIIGNNYSHNAKKSIFGYSINVFVGIHFIAEYNIYTIQMSH